MLSSFSNSAFSMRYFKIVATGGGGGGGSNAFDGMDILPRSDIVFDTAIPATSSAYINDYKFGVDEVTKVNGEFKVTCSNTAFALKTYEVGKAFKYGILDTWALNSANYQNVSPYAFNGQTTTTASGTDYRGEWLQIECPMSFVLKYFSYLHHRNGPGIWALGVVIVASNNGITWNYLTTIDAPTVNDTGSGTQLSTNTTIYNYYRYIVTKSNVSNPYLSSIVMKSYIPVGYNTTFSLPAIFEGNNYNNSWVNTGQQTIEGWTFPTTNWVVQRFNNLELTNAACFYTYEGLSQKYVVRFVTDRPQTQKMISQNTPFTTGTYTVGIKVNTCKGNSNDVLTGYSYLHKIYVKIGGVDVFPEGIGLDASIGRYPTTQPWINPKNISFDIPTDGDRTMEIWSVSTSGEVSNLFVAELVVYKN